jgi:hypothetical protein
MISTSAPRRQQLLASALTGAATALAIVLLTGAKSPSPTFDVIDVGRINVREPDGTLRMVISNRAQFPGSPWKGGEIARPDRKQFAGMVFVNDEGTENGGLIQKGVVGPDGRVSAGLSLSFDRFRQDQVMQLLHAEDNGRAYSMFAINDESDGTRFDVMQRAERLRAVRAMDETAGRAAMQEMRDQGQMPRNRVRLGTSLDGAAVLSLADGGGKPRLLLMVSRDGVPSIQMFDAQGKPGKSIRLDADAAGASPSSAPQTGDTPRRNPDK